MIKDPQELKVRPKKEFTLIYEIGDKQLTRETYNPVPSEIQETVKLPAKIELPQYYFHSIQLPRHESLKYTPFAHVGNKSTKKNVFSGPLYQLLSRYFESRLLFENYTTALVDYVRYIQNLNKTYDGYGYSLTL